MPLDERLKQATQDVLREWDVVAIDYMEAFNTYRVPASEVVTYCLDRLGGSGNRNIQALLERYDFDALRDMVLQDMPQSFYGP